MSKLKLIFYNILLFVTFILFSESRAQTTIVGLAKVIDGDTIIINKTKIRFGGIDAPESYYKGKTQTCFIIASNEEFLCGKKSKIILENKLAGKTISCITEKNKDKYERVIAECFLNFESISSFMVRSGYAFDYKKYSKGKYSDDEIVAKKNNLGMWSMKFDYPWIWRNNNK